LVFPEKRYYSKEIRDGFLRFCHEFSITHRVINDFSQIRVAAHEAYVVISDEDLVSGIKLFRESGLVPGKNCGIISYNENPVKEILEGGITTISTNHHLMGKVAAKMIRGREKAKIRIPFELEVRNSL
jgi:DNA-binding LacI/PurR family transcriptional regulator